MTSGGTRLDKSLWRRASDAFWDWLRAPAKRAPSEHHQVWIVALVPIILVAITLLGLMWFFGLI